MIQAARNKSTTQTSTSHRTNKCAAYGLSAHTGIRAGTKEPYQSTGDYDADMKEMCGPIESECNLCYDMGYH